MTAAGFVRRANPSPVRPRRPTSRPATCICPVRPANDARPAWAIGWAAAVTPRYPLHEACAAGPCIYNLAFDRHPLLADAVDDAVYIDAGILAHCREPGEQVMMMWPPPPAIIGGSSPMLIDLWSFRIGLPSKAGVGVSGPKQVARIDLATSAERTGAENASTRIHLGVSVLRALRTSVCAPRSRGPKRVSRITAVTLLDGHS
jgi:hypothetical protein